MSSRETAPAGTLATRLNKNCQAHLQVGRPAIRSKHMRQITTLLVFDREYKGIGPLRSRYITNDQRTPIMSMVFWRGFFVGAKPALLLFVAASASCGIDEDAHGFNNPIPPNQPPSTLVKSC